MEHFYSMVYFSKGRRVTAETSGKRDDCELFLSKERLVPNLLFGLHHQPAWWLVSRPSQKGPRVLEQASK